MTPRDAFQAGMAARERDEDAALGNPHSDFELGTAWSLGWHWHGGTWSKWMRTMMRVAGWGYADLGDWEDQ